MYKPEIFGIIISIFSVTGLITLLFTYIKPELEKQNNPDLMIAFWICSSIMILFVFLLVFFLLRQTKNLKRTNRQLREENKYLHKQQKRRK